MDKRQMDRQNAWNEKAGYVSKSYKLKKNTVETFATACAAAGVSQAAKLTELMNGFANSVNQCDNRETEGGTRHEGT